LKNGSVPLKVLEDQINAYIETTLVKISEEDKKKTKLSE
jgi:hypothetical protein